MRLAVLMLLVQNIQMPMHLKLFLVFQLEIRLEFPGGGIPRAIKKLWKLKLFTDIQIHINKKIDNVIFLVLTIQERPRLSRHSFTGVKKVKHDDLNDAVNSHLLKGGIVTENTKVNASNSIKEYYEEKGFLDAQVTVNEVPDTILANSIRLVFDVDPGDRVKIEDIIFEGVSNVKEKKLRNMMKETRRKKRLLASSKYIKELYETDKDVLIAYYNTLGFRDASIAKDSVYRSADGENVVLHLTINEGNRYHFGDISWKGNSIYSDKQLTDVLGIVRGDIFNTELLESRISFSQDSRDINSLYMDNGYLFFQASPVEVAIVGDTIDLEVRMFEGPQAIINDIIIKGNDRTHEHVIRRELYTRPGEKFSRSDIIRSQRQILALGYFNQETLGINPIPNPQLGTVDIEYTVEEKPSDQLELSAGWGGLGRGVIGTLGVTFNNFSLRNAGKKGAWRPVPQGDGQRLSLRAQTNGRFYQSYNFSFTEPWLGGKKPNAFTFAAFHTKYSRSFSADDIRSQMSISGLSVSLGTRLKFPDDFFVGSVGLNLQNISLLTKEGNTPIFPFSFDNGQQVRNGSFNNFSLNLSLSRNSIDAPIFPTSGSKISVNAQLTPPYSGTVFRNKDYTDLSLEEQFKYLEYHKWRINGEWYSSLVGKLVLKASAKIGFLGTYNDRIGLSPFERFELGGDGISNQVGIQGKDIISLRGYEVEDLSVNRNYDGAAIFNKFALELRYPFSLNPMSTIFVLGFVEGGNSWINFKDFNPFDLHRSAGMGLRVFLPMFGHTWI